VLAALSAQAAELLNASPGLHTRPAHLLARALCHASGLSRVFFSTTGAEANEGAIKLARKWGQKARNGAFEIITTSGSFHGRTLATMAASGKPGFDSLFPPRVPGFVKVPYGDAEAVARAIGKDTVAVWVEPIQGEGGVVVPPDGYLRALRSLTRDAGILLMLDEVQTGMARTGTLFACQHEDVVPDVMTLGKGLGGGVPVSALLASEAVSCFSPGDQGGTFTGHPLLTAVGLAVFEELSQPGFLAHVRAMGELLKAGLVRRSAPYAGLVRGRGLLWAMSLPKPQGPAVVDAALRHGLLVNSPRPELLRFMPALNVTETEIAGMLGRLDAALADVFGQ
jgi:acetylornithine/N-succinyldiaminopimelate aminotransferase